MKKFALAGNPNSGKTTLFNSLTGSTAYVGNWPGVTVEQREGIYKKLKEHVKIVDLPGIYSLSPYTPEEIISRNFILEEHPDCVINIIDATNLERNLYLTTQLLEMNVPVVIALNMMDAVKKNGDVIDSKKLAELIKVPVVEISALKENNLEQLMKVAYEESKKNRIGFTVIKNKTILNLIDKLEEKYQLEEVSDPLFHSLKMAELDEIEVEKHKELIPLISEAKKDFNDEIFGKDFEAIIADDRYKYISSYYISVLKRKEIEIKKDKKGKVLVHHSISDKIDKVLTNKWAGIPIFLFILLVIFHFTFSTNFLFIGSFFDGKFPTVGPEGFNEILSTADGINSPGVIIQSLVISITDWFTGLVKGWMVGSPSWTIGLIGDGLLTGLFSVISFLPQILMLFLFFSILEDSGYMARVAFILDRIFRKFGLSGRAFMPMIMGFGCSVPAMINTRTLADEKEKIATIRVIPFFSCGAKLPILTATAGAIVTYFHMWNPDIITFLMYVLGMVVAVIAVILMRKTTMKGEVPPFIMELPSYHLPQFKGLMIHLWDKTKHFIKKVFTIILVATLAIWLLQHFSFNWTYLEDEAINESILAGFGQLIQPLFTPLGFGSQLSSWGWVFPVAAITGLLAKEQVISTFSVLAICIATAAKLEIPDGGYQDADAVFQMIQATSISPAGLLSFIAFNMTTIPCFAAIATAKAELPKGKTTTTIFFWVITSYVIASAIYLIGTWWWTAFIFVGIIGIIILGIYLFNKFSNKRIKNS